MLLVSFIQRPKIEGFECFLPNEQMSPVFSKLCIRLLSGNLGCEQETLEEGRYNSAVSPGGLDAQEEIPLPVIRTASGK